ncbi:hypothetical protein D918_05451 [Trichuris suis]|nr:hypothetical protein D918_05451 [Trichuris suis]
MDSCTERWIECCKFLKTSRGKRMVRRRLLNPMYPEHMIKLYINLDKWSRPRKRNIRRYMLAEDYEARLAEGSGQSAASDEESSGRPFECDWRCPNSGCAI